MKPTAPAATLPFFRLASARGPVAGPARGGGRSVGPAASRVPLRAERATVVLKAHPKIAQRILGHSRTAMTPEVSPAASDDEVRAALGKPSDAMGGTGQRGC